MKILSIMLISLVSFLATNGVETKTNFIEEVEDTYNYYQVVAQTPDTFSEYQFVVVAGTIDEENVFGIYFYSADKDKYDIYVKVDDEIYQLETDTRGDVYNLAIKYDNSTIVTYHVFSNNELGVTGEIVYSSTSALPGNGNNDNVTYSKLTSLNDMYRNQIILYVSLGSVIMICIIILVIYASTHSGMFSKSRRGQSVFNMKEFLANSSDEADPYDPLANVTLNSNDNPPIEGEVVNEVKEAFNIKKYLSDKGFIIDYRTLSEEEKNSIMLELMMLKNSSKITEEEYKKETIELWKK